jgi:hypothetical protein
MTGYKLVMKLLKNYFIAYAVVVYFKITARYSLVRDEVIMKLLKITIQIYIVTKI